MELPLLLAITLTVIKTSTCANILMITMGGTKSHKIPFLELAKGLTPRGHNVTFVSAFPGDVPLPGIEEITPTSFVFYVKNFTNWDLVGNKIRGEEPVPIMDIFRYSYETCEALLSDEETRDLLRSGVKYDLLVLDGAYLECAVGFVHYFKAPFIYINTVAFYTNSLSLAGNPTPYSVTPFFAQSFTDSMNLVQRTTNTLWHLAANIVHSIHTRILLQPILRKHFGDEIPQIYDITRNASFILQNAHATVTHPRPYLPNVAEIACIHCKEAKRLPRDLEEFIEGSGDAGFIFFSMGSSVKAANMPEYMQRMLIQVFQQLPQRVLWKYEDERLIPDLPSNVMLSPWLPQQDLLGHPKIRAFVTHGGLLSMFETVYHGVPVVSLPVFCDHDSNAAKAEKDGYALVLDLAKLNAKSLLWAIRKVIHDPTYSQNVKRRQALLRDQRHSPLETAIYWTEYVLRHKGAPHLQSPAREMGVIQYYLLDVTFILISLTYVLWVCAKISFSFLTGKIGIRIFRKNIKLD